jgi:hypothetical protein
MLRKLFSTMLFLIPGILCSSITSSELSSGIVRRHKYNHLGGGGGYQQPTIVTVTVTQQCPTPTQPIQNIIEELSKGKDKDSKDLDSQEHCLYLLNKLRNSQNLPLLKSAPQSEIDCANRAAIYDASAGYHASFGIRMCAASSQCECKKTVGQGIPGSVTGDPLQNCINAYIAEYTQGLYPQENLGHWKIITGNYKSVACGTNGDGFYTHNFYA